MQTILCQTNFILTKPYIVRSTLKQHGIINSETRKWDNGSQLVNTATNVLTKNKKFSFLTICNNNATPKIPLATTLSTGTGTGTGTYSLSSESIFDDDEYRKHGVEKECIPNHVAIILDGTRRWSKENGKAIDYQRFFKANTLFADQCLKWGIGTATTYIYSLKNLRRGHEANELLFGQLQTYLEENVENIKRKGIKLWMIGQKSSLPNYLLTTINKIEEETKNNTKLELMLALCYGGTNEIAQATKNICIKVNEGEIDPEKIDEDLMDQYLWTGPSRAPNPDLLIRTGGRIRVSNYLIWQLAQTELYFCDKYAPEFMEPDFIEALRSYQQRERTFGN